MKSSLFFSLGFLCLCISLLPSFSTSTILFQGFVWASSDEAGGWWNHLKPLVPEIAASGAEYVWLPPPSNADKNGRQGYLPKRLYDLDTSSYGNKEELKSLVATFQQSGVKAVSDIVINHRMPESNDSNGRNSVFEGGTPDSRLDWGVAEICRDDPEYQGTGNPDTGMGWGGVPDIDHTSTRVQQELSDWMNWLKTEVGFSGWRFDMVLGYAPKFTKLYIDNTKPEFSVGELFQKVHLGSDNKPLTNQDEHRNTLVNWVNEVGSGVLTFDFTTKMILGYATYPFPEDKIMLGYVYILTHPGHPSIFYHDYFERENGIKENIKSLSAIRKRNGITATSTINILAAEADLYMANIDNKIIVKIGPNGNLGNLLPSNAQVATKGQDYAVWELK
ncbi:hypothetical protein PIB30_078674 [Stylosanthes scabra]|uniref:alpha-amylase n=1 Tax=Stylosanthes scabra TaxID=79078 RepID=A0ABU6QS49_9FABA|nr:hypothetical protein [Stylosanthes scabra]